MDNLNRSLLDYLRSKDPVLICDNCPGGANTTSKARNFVTPGWIDKWEDFEYDSLRSIYGGTLHRVLKREFPLQDFSAIPQVPFCEVFDENSLDTLLTKWNHSVVSEALSTAQRCLYKSQTSKTIYMAKGGQANFPESVKFRPDWAGVQPATLRNNELKKSSVPRRILPGDAKESTKPRDILPGDTKVSKKWSSLDIVLGQVQTKWTTKDWLRPLNQLYTYCVKANARYGYIITDKELVVIRIRPNLRTEDSQPTNEEFESARAGPQETKAKSRMANHSKTDDENIAMLCDGRLEYKAIPWSTTESEDPQHPDSLTVNLALWWLHVMASVSREIEEQYPALKELAKPTWFADENSHSAFSETLVETRPTIAIGSRRSSGADISHDGAKSHDTHRSSGADISHDSAKSHDTRRSSGANISHDSAKSHDTRIGHSVGHTRSKRGTKRPSVDDDGGSQSKRQTRWKG